MIYKNWNKIDSFIGSEEDPLKNYNYFFKKIDFSKCNYSFIIPEPFSDLFASFYSKILKDSFIIFPKNFEQAKELLNDYENEEGYKENWIIIAPCIELKKNIKVFHENIDIICFIGYCPIFNHWDDESYFHLFSKFYGIVDSYSELIEKLFQLSNIFYFRKNYNYFINNKNADIIELKYDTKFLINIQDENSKECVISEKLDKLYDFKMNNDQYYFTLIKTYNFLSKCLKEKNYNLIDQIIGKYLPHNMLYIEFLPYEKGTICAVFLKDLHLLYFYFHNYPYLYGLLTDEEINHIFSKFKPNMEKKELDKNFLISYNAIAQITTLFAMNIDMGISLFEDKERLKNFQLSLIEFNLFIEYIYQEFDIEKFGKYYQIKNFFRDIDFCLCKFIYNIINLCTNFPLKNEIFHYMCRDNQFCDYINYGLHLQKDNITPETEDEKIFNQAIKYNDTIVIGDKNFIDIIKKMKLPCKNLYYINEKEILNFFKNPKKINNKYHICKYLIIINEKNAIDYLETLKYICNEYFLKIIIIIYFQNKNIKIDKKILQKPLIPIILTYSEQDILNYYNDHFFLLKEKNIKYFDRNAFLDEAYGTNFKNYKLPKLAETKFIKEEDNGWDMKKDINTNIFDLIKVERVLGFVRTDIFVRNMYKVYKENNCLDLYFKYYGHYF